MDPLETWATKIAEEVAPDEVDLAPTMVHAFVSGGRDRKELFHQQGAAVQGAFGPDFAAAMFPFVLQTITVAWIPLHWLLTAQPVENLAAINDLIGITDRLRRRRKVESLPEDAYAPLKQTINIMSDQLRSEGLSQDKADLVTFRVIRRMLEEPSGAARFVEEVEKAS